MAMDTRADGADLVFIHLSDIHFRHGRVGDAHDEDKPLRKELQLDLRRLRTRLPQLDGLIISGDIAFGGKTDEYQYASGWIKTICEHIGCERNAVMVTPGNHDIDQDLIPLDGEVDLLHQEIRGAASPEEYDERLAAILRTESRARILLSPLAAYNTFARKYGCQISPNCPYWERDFKLRDGTTLRFRGIATNLLSSSRDDHATHRMLYGSAQRAILREPNVRNVIVGHHPPSWTVESDRVDQIFSILTCLQVFGHKHEQWVTPVGNSVRLIAGAVHPSRRDSNWLPRYAAVTISALDGENLQIVIYPRRWSTEELQFIGDFNSQGKDFRRYVVAVEPLQTEGDK
jgi:hypothetical protein